MKKYKEVDELLKQYVQSTNGDPEKDLAKVDFSKYESKGTCAQGAVAKKRMPAYGWAIIATAFVLIIALSVSLPLTLGSKTTPQGSEIYYFDYETVDKVEINISSVKDVLIQDTFLPTVEFIDSSVWCLTAENNTINVGVLFDLSVFDEFICDISGNIIYENIELSSLSKFNSLANSDTWNDIEVHYGTQIDEVLLAYEYKITFNANGFNHYYTITTASEMEIGELMDWVF